MRMRPKRVGELLAAALQQQSGRKDPLRIRRYRVISTNKVGVLSTPALDADVTSYQAPESIFEVKSLRVDQTTNRRFFQMGDDSGWIPEYSRKNSKKLVVVEHFGLGPMLALTGYAEESCKGTDSESGSDDKRSSSSSSSSSSA